MRGMLAGLAGRALPVSRIRCRPALRAGGAAVNRFCSRRNLCDTVRVTFKDADGDTETVDAVIGDSLLDVAHDNDIEVEGACGGEMACSTCHVILEQHVFDSLDDIEEEEEDMLDLALGLTDTSRLGCQVFVTKEMDGITVQLPSEISNMQ